MRFIVEQNHFLHCVQHCQGVVDRKKINPILGQLLVRAEDGRLTLSASDETMYLCSEMEADVAEAGAVLVSARKLFDVLREWPNDATVTCQMDEQVLRLSCGASRFRLNTMAADMFPAPPTLRVEQAFTLPASTLARMIRMSAFCISSDQSRKFLTGASFVYDREKQRLQARTSNAYHMGLLSLPLEMDDCALSECMIPQRVWVEMRRLCESENTPVTLHLGPRQVCLQVGPHTLYGKTIEERFPAYEHILPDALPCLLEMQRIALDQALRRCLLVSDESTHDINFRIDDDGLQLSAYNRNQESAQEWIEADIALSETIEKPYVLALDGAFLREVIQALNGERVQMHFRDNRSPVLIVDAEDTLARYFMMPLKETASQGDS